MDQKIGEVTHYYTHLGVAIIDLAAPLAKGDKIHIKGHTTDFEQTVEELQLDHKDIEQAEKGQIVGLKVADHVREGDQVLGA